MYLGTLCFLILCFIVFYFYFSVYMSVFFCLNLMLYFNANKDLYKEPFVHDRLDRALILLGLAFFRAPLCLLCTLVLYVKKIF